MHLRLIERAWSFYDVNNKVKMGNAVDDDIITRKKSLVTGVSRRKGIGAAICEALADKDAGFYSRICPVPKTSVLLVVMARKPIGPRACSFCVLIPISAPYPNCSPSVKRVEALW
jgi:hypothetical protein